VDFLNENHETKLISVTEVEYPRFEIEFGGKNKNKDNEIIEVAEFIGVKSYKAKGKRLSSFHVENINEVEPVVKSETKIDIGEQIEEDDKSEPPAGSQNNDSGQMRLEM
jgi:topoisomerase-4 subunit A